MYTYSVSHPSNTLHIYHTSVYRFVFNFFFRFLFNSLSLITTKWSDIWEHDETWSVHVYNYARATFFVLFFEVEGGGERGWMGCVFIYNISDCITCFLYHTWLYTFGNGNGNQFDLISLRKLTGIQCMVFPARKYPLALPLFGLNVDYKENKMNQSL